MGAEKSKKKLGLSWDLNEWCMEGTGCDIWGSDGGGGGYGDNGDDCCGGGCGCEDVVLMAWIKETNCVKKFALLRRWRVKVEEFQILHKINSSKNLI